MSELLDAALRYAKHGWPVFPTHTPKDGGCSCGRCDCHYVGKHPRTRNGLSDATTDVETITRWSEMWPDANWAVVTGREADIFVLDQDPRHGGGDSLHELEREHGPLPKTASVKTPSGGEHFYFRYPDVEVRNSEGKVAAGLDVRGEGGYVLVPPSLGATGRRYEADEHAPPAEAPGWLLELATERRNGHAPPVGDEIPDGQRNATLASLAGTMRRRGMDGTAISAALRETNRIRCKPPLADDEVEGIAASIARYEPVSSAASKYTLDYDKNGNLTLPPKPKLADVAGLCSWLTAVFALDPSHPITGGKRRGVRGVAGCAELSRMDAPALTFDPITRLNAPQRLIEALTADMLPSDDAIPSFKGVHCKDIAHVVRMLTGIHEALTAEQETAAIIGTLRQIAQQAEGEVTCYGTASGRAAMVEALRHGPDEPMRYARDFNTGEYIVTVRDLNEVARKHMGMTMRHGWLEARLDAFGWTRAELQGYVDAPGGGRGKHVEVGIYRGFLAEPVDG